MVTRLAIILPQITPIIFNDFGLRSVTRHYQVGSYAGLHYDDCDKMPASLSSLSRNRLCLNIGLEARYFIFQNLFREDIKLSGQKTERMGSSYPLLKLKLKPFEGYIAPIERILHEGCTYHMTQPDLSVAVRSHISILTLPETKHIFQSIVQAF